MRSRFGLRFSFAATAFVDRYAELLAPLALTPSRVLALAFVREHPGCEQRLLANGLAITEASAMAKVNRLEALGFIERRAGADRRSKALHLTGHGEACYAEAVRIEDALSDHLLGWVGDDMRGAVEQVIDGILARALEAIPPPADRDPKP